MHSLALTIGNQALVLKEFTVNSEGEEYVHIVARKEGIISWLLTRFGIDATTVFRVYANRIEFEEGSVSGRIQTVLPLRSISIASCGYTKPFILLVLGILFTIGAFASFGLTLILAIPCFIFYFLKKSLMISVFSNSGYPILICFKRSVIEGVKVEYEQAEQVIQIINQLLMHEASK